MKPFMVLLFVLVVVGLVASASLGKGKVYDQDNICKLPKLKGYCRALIRRWWYDASSGKCRTFNWGGCDANANNFDSLEDCLANCEGVK